MNFVLCRQQIDTRKVDTPMCTYQVREVERQVARISESPTLTRIFARGDMGAGLVRQVSFCPQPAGSTGASHAMAMPSLGLPAMRIWILARLVRAERYNKILRETAVTIHRRA